MSPVTRLTHLPPSLCAAWINAANSLSKQFGEKMKGHEGEE